MTHRTHRPGGWFAADTIMGLAIVLILAALLATAVTRQRKGTERLAESRAAARVAEQIVTAMQSGAAVPPAPQGMNIEIRKVEAPSQPSGMSWVDVRVNQNGRSSNVIGLVRAEAAAAAAATGGPTK
jgi:type II secretory pathway pseudopilin PulG